MAGYQADPEEKPMASSNSSQSLRGKGTDRVFDILEFLASKADPSTIPEISIGTACPRSTTYLLVEQLEERGYIDRASEGRYHLGQKVALLGKAATKHLDFPNFIRGAVQKLALDSQQLSEFVALDNWKQLVLIAAAAQRPSYMLSTEGSRHPLPRTASSRFLLRDIPREEILGGVKEEDYVLRDGSTLPESEFLASIEASRGKDIFMLAGQVDPHLACIACPITNAEGQCIAAISLVVPLVDLEGQIEHYSSLLRTAATTITQQFSLVAIGQRGILGLLLHTART
ncbi:helix-turn-helix domain-containing protein [Aureimonas fodinaquatilis]|uniref:Helix-turn-helix domain-containing protein n=1 Tax=Aureimonas fodinaquatilis TaxID=2565783 RepID=A0A5B0E2I9_9HYPH|nr:IclR family transcriptional regulator C-terminal domain-containing protein [Aureimonas fodinaquatilis]KAA0971970.1 helix-turn-helix domain-containing protein [Aureimonas fodinaquatilis]